jgi:drug/metabolite transporter (DMT)-like permease
MMIARETIPHHLTSATFFALGFLAIGATVGAYLLWMIAVERLQVADAAVYFYIQPIAGVLLSVVLTGTRITASFMIGSLMILGALFLGLQGEPQARADSDVTASP